MTQNNNIVNIYILLAPNIIWGNMKRNKPYKILLVLIISGLFLGGTFASAQLKTEDESDNKITIEFNVDYYELESIKGYDELKAENFGRLLVPGKPNLPSKIFAIAIPPGAEITDVTYEIIEEIQLPGNYLIEPSPLHRVIGEEDPQLYAKDKEIYDENYENTYGSNNPYPENIVEFVRKAGYRKYNLVDVRITPFSYKPISKTITYYPKISLEVNYKISNQAEIISDNFKSTENVAKKIIYNYEQAKYWYENNEVSRGLNDYVIITKDSLVGSVEPLANWEANKGRTVEVVTTSWIESNYNGYDLAEKIRNFLRDKYPGGEWGIQDALLVGSYTDVPMRRTAQNLGYGRPRTEFYYAELSLPDDQSWDADGDHNYGENSDPIDFYSEINVGRIPFNDPDTVEHICQKSILYEQNADPTFKKNILLLGAFFWDNDPNPRTDNAVLMETKVDQPWMSDWTMTRMYEEGHSTYPMDYNLLNSNVVSVWSQGKYGFVNWAGHGSPGACWRYHYPDDYFISVYDCDQLNDDYPAIIFADACSNSDTDDFNIGMGMLEQGGVGFVGATKVALGCPGWDDPYDGSSQSIDYFFTTFVTSEDYTQGEALQTALVEMYQNGLWYDNRYETFEWCSLWGNPNLGMTPISGSVPQIPQTPEGIESGEINLDYDFTTSTTDPEENQLFYMWDWGDGRYSEWIGPFESGEEISANHTWGDEGNFLVRVKAKNELGMISAWSDPLSVLIEDLSEIEIRAISGVLGVNVNIKNTGTRNAYNFDWSISVDGDHLLKSEDVDETVDVLEPDESIRVGTGIIFGFGKIDIEVDAKDDSKTATAIILGPFIFNVNTN